MRVIRQAIAISLATAGILGTASAEDQITFQQVLSSPSDQKLNITYAQQRIAAGDLLAAAATLERLLIDEPNWDEARLMYAGVLYRLGDYSAAKREADLLEGRDFSDSALVEVEKYREAASKKTQKTRLSGRFSAGLGYDENAGSQLAEDNLTPEPVDQYSLVLRGLAKIEHDLSDTSELRLFAEGDGYFKQFEDDEFEDFLIISGRAGVAGETKLFDWRTNLSARKVQIGGEGYLTETGVQARILRDFNPRTRAVVNVGYHDQDYSNVFGAGDVSDARDGERVDVSASLYRTFSPMFRGSLGVSYRDKSTDSNVADLAYEFVGFQGGLDVFWRNGVYIDTGLVYRDYEYTGTREDEFTYGRAALGLPFSLFCTAAAADSFVFETAITRTDRSSNVAAFDFDSVGGEARLIYRF